MKTTGNFEAHILPRRQDLRREWIDQVLRPPVHEEQQPDGRVRLWAFVPELGKYLRVVVPENRETVLNAFPDRRFKEAQP